MAAFQFFLASLTLPPIVFFKIHRLTLPLCLSSFLSFLRCSYKTWFANSAFTRLTYKAVFHLICRCVVCTYKEFKSRKAIFWQSFGRVLLFLQSLCLHGLRVTLNLFSPFTPTIAAQWPIICDHTRPFFWINLQVFFGFFQPVLCCLKFWLKRCWWATVVRK